MPCALCPNPALCNPVCRAFEFAPDAVKAQMREACEASGQMTAQEVSAHVEAGEMPVSEREPLSIRRVWAMPNRDTFDVPPMGDLVRKHLTGVSVDPFARNKRWATHTNDLNPATTAEHHMEAADFLSMLADTGVLADVVIFDPPYSPRQIAECYQAAGLPTNKQTTQNARLYADCRRAIRRLCKPGTRVLSFGWNSAGMGKGFRLEELLLVNHGAAHNDTICMVEICATPKGEAGEMEAAKGDERKCAT